MLKKAFSQFTRSFFHERILLNGLAPSRITSSLISTSSTVAHGQTEPSPDTETVQVTFVERDGTERTIKASVGQDLLTLAHSNEIDLEGACEGSLACSTCHVIVEDQRFYDSLPEPEDDENDMLDLAFGLTETSRLGCQIKMTTDLDGLRVKIPSASRNIARNERREFQLRMMMQTELEEMYYDDGGLEDYYEDDDFEEGPLAKVARTYRWVRPGYIPPGESGRKKTPLEERTQEIERLKTEIAEKEKRLKLVQLQSEIKELTARVNEKEQLVRKRQANAVQAEIDKKLTKKHERERKTKIQSTFKQVFNVTSEENTSGANGVVSCASLEDIRRIRSSQSDYECFQLSPPTPFNVIKKKYKELAKMLHPDKCNLEGAKEAFQKIKIAYDRLSQLCPTNSAP